MVGKTFKVPNISCHHCLMTIERELGALDGVKSVKAELATKSVIVEWDDPASWRDIVELLTEINYPPV
jgi:copper ion binding protein